MPEIAGQRLRRIGLARGDIGGCLQPGKIRPETEMRGSNLRFKLWEKAKKRLVEQKNEEPTSVNWKLALPIAADENGDELQDL